jgi:hypothetical protein
MRKIPFLCLILALFLVLSGCGKEDQMPVIDLVQGNLDVMYTGVADDVYKDLTGQTPEDCSDAYLKNLEREARYFLAYYGYSDEGLEEEVLDQVIRLYEALYQKAEYTVGPAVQFDEETQAVKVQVSPLDLFQLAAEDTELREELFEPIRRQYYWINLEATDWSDPALYSRSPYYAQCRADSIKALVELCRAHMDEVSAGEPETVIVQVSWHEYGYWTINDADWRAVDELMIAYP